MRVRGLKQKLKEITQAHDLVAPRAGAWIETPTCSDLTQMIESHPVRVRGLKQVLREIVIVGERSHPVRVRGLKQTDLIPLKSVC